MAITDTLYIVSILVGLFVIHFGFPVLLIWLLKVLVYWACRDAVAV